MLLYWLWLAQKTEVNNGVKKALLEHFDHAEDLFYAKKEDYLALDIQGLKENAVDALCEKDLSPAEELLGRCAKLGLRVLSLGDREYPQRLRQIFDPPAVLYYKGTLPRWDKLPVVAVVGTRKSSIYGNQTARRVGREIARQGGLLVSGLAQGIDAQAMGGALGEGFPAVGVLGCGADVVYPKVNRALFAQTERLGCILSEFAPGTPPLKQNFPRRNRIISGLSCGIVVVEAPEHSGALLTAARALEQGRDVFVVPGNVDMESFRGSHRLLRNGAIAVASGEDVMAEYTGLYPEKLARATAPAPVTQEKPAQKPAVSKKLKEKTIDNGPSRPYSEQNDALAGLSPLEQAIMAAIGNEIAEVDDVIARVGRSSGEVLGTLTMLEIKKRILRHPGKRVSRLG